MKNKPHSDSGFSLVEVTPALIVVAFSLVTILGLLPVGLNSDRSSIEQTVGAAGRQGSLPISGQSPRQ